MRSVLRAHICVSVTKDGRLVRRRSRAVGSGNEGLSQFQRGAVELGCPFPCSDIYGLASVRHWIRATFKDYE